MTLATVQLTGALEDQNGKPADGWSLVLELTGEVRGNGVTGAPYRELITLDEQGQIPAGMLVLPSSAFDPSPVSYRVTEMFGTGRIYYVNIPDVGPVDLFSLAPLGEPSDSVTQYAPQALLDAEIARAETRESSLQDQVDALDPEAVAEEQARAEAAETALGGRITNETNRAEGVEATKANLADLAAVATSGSYNDLDDTPTLGSAAGHSSTDFDGAGAAAAAQSAAQGHADSLVAGEQARAEAVEAAKADLVGGKVPTSQLPAFSSFQTWPVASQAAMLALAAAKVGDIAIRSDQGGRRYWLSGTPASTLGNWLDVAIDPSAAVDSVNGQIGPVVLGPADVGADPAGSAAAAQAAAQTYSAGIVATETARAEAAEALKANAADLAAVATSGSYNDLTGKPTLGTAASHAVGDFDPAGAAAAALTTGETYTDTKITAEVTRADGKYSHLLSGTIDTATSGTLVANTAALISAAAGAVIRALPTTAPIGAQLIVGKSDSSANTVTATGTINGVGASSRACAAPGSTITFVSDGAGGWITASNDLTSFYDARYAAAGSAVGASLAYADLATGVPSIALPATVGGVVQWVDITGAPLAISPVLGTRAVELEATLQVQTSAAQTILVGIYDATAAAIIAAAGFSFTGASFDPMIVSVQVTPGAGTRNYRPMLGNITTTAITATVYGKNVNSIISSIKCTQR